MYALRRSGFEGKRAGESTGTCDFNFMPQGHGYHGSAPQSLWLKALCDTVTVMGKSIACNQAHSIFVPSLNTINKHFNFFFFNILLLCRHKYKKITFSLYLLFDCWLYCYVVGYIKRKGRTKLNLRFWSVAISTRCIDMRSLRIQSIVDRSSNCAKVCFQDTWSPTPWKLILKAL